jgi:hypothetical protein
MSVQLGCPPARTCDLRAPLVPERAPGWACEEITTIVTGRVPIIFLQNANPRHVNHSGVDLRFDLCVCLT